VFIIEQDDIDQVVSVAIEDAITQAGATDSGRLVFTKKWKLADDASLQQLAADVASSESTVPAVLRDAATRLGARLGLPGDPSKEGDLLGVLQRDGFVALRGIPPGVFPQRGSLAVDLWAGTTDAYPDETSFAIPLLQAFPAKTIAAVAEPLDSKASLCDRLRGDHQLSSRIAGIDHVDLLPGRLSLISALRDLAAGLPAPQYGIRRGATAVVPPATTS